METFEVKKKIANWIDNVFGVNQYNIKAKNVYKKFTYGEFSNFEQIINEAESMEDGIAQMRIAASKVILFGQHPMRLFDKKHESKFNSQRIVEMDDFTQTFNMISKSKNKVSMKKIINCQKPIRSARLVTFSSIEVITEDKTFEIYKLISDKEEENKQVSKLKLSQFEGARYVKKNGQSNFKDLYADRKDKYLVASLGLQACIVARNKKPGFVVVTKDEEVFIETKRVLL